MSSSPAFERGCIEYGAGTIEYSVTRSPRRDTLAIEVHPDSVVRVRAPLECDLAVIERRVLKRANWISRQIDFFERFRPRTPPRQYISGETHLYLGRQYRLKVQTGQEDSVKLSRGCLLVTQQGVVTRARTKALLRDWYRRQAKAVFQNALTENLTKFRVPELPRLVVREMRSRWGSLSDSGTMTLNVELVRAPKACIEYVIVHELCHMKRRNHDATFYRLLGRLMPDWEKRKRRLEMALL